MKFISKLLLLPASIALGLTVAAWILDATVLKAEFIINTANKEGSFRQVSKALPKALANNNQQGQTVLAGITTPQYVEEKLGGFLIGLENYHRKNGPIPTLDLSDIAVSASTQGYHIPAADLPVLKYQESRTSSPLAKIYSYVSSIKLLGLLAFAVIGGLAIASSSHKAKAFAKSAAGAAFILGIFFAVLHVAPGIVAGQIKGMPDEAAKAVFESALSVLGVAFRQSAKLMLIAAAALIIAGLATVITGWVLTKKSGGHKGQGEKRLISKFHPPEK